VKSIKSIKNIYLTDSFLSVDYAFLILLKKPSSPTLIILIFLSFYTPSFSQNQDQYNYINKAKELINNQELPEAIKILKDLEKEDPRNLDVIQLYSQALYWNQDFDATLALYKKSMKNFPQSDVLKIHFGRIHFELNNYFEAKKLLTSYVEQQPEDPEAGILLATIAYWEGKPPQVALEYLDEVLEHHPENSDAKALMKEILVSTAPNLRLSSAFYSDSQPLQAKINTVEYSNYQSSWLQPSVMFQNRNFKQADPTLLIQLSNKAFFSKSGTELLMRVGLFNDSWHNEFSPTYGFDVRQKIVEKWSLSGGIDRRPYVFTLASLNNNLMPTTYSAGLGRQSDRWTGNISMSHTQFEDDNYVRVGTASLIFALIKSSTLKINLGYGFMMADSKESRFRLADPFHAYVHETEIGTQFPGIFDPYFTPQNQSVHSIISDISFKISPKIQVNLYGNIGINARIDNPNVIFYGSSDPSHYVEHPAPIDPNITTPVVAHRIHREDIYRIMIPTEYFPMDLKGSFNWNMTKNLNLKTEYAYQRAVFFDSHMLSLGLNWTLSNE